MSARCRQNYHSTSEAEVNKQINLELYVSYVYMSMAYYFDRDDVALPGFHKYFKTASDGERVHAEKLMKYQNQRGGRIILKDIKKPEKEEWKHEQCNHEDCIGFGEDHERSIVQVA